MRIIIKYQLLVTLLFCINISSAESSFIPKGVPLKSFILVNPNWTNADDYITMVTLQGIVSKSSSEQIYYAGPLALSVWANQIKKLYGIPQVATEVNMWKVIERYKSFIKGYVLYNGINERNQATSLCGILNAVAVDKSRESTFRTISGITTKLADVQGKTERQIWETYKNQFNKRFACELNKDIYFQCRDYAVMGNMFVFSSNPDTSFKMEVVNSLADSAGIFGYADVSVEGEYGAFSHTQKVGVFALGCDLAYDLSIMSSIVDSTLIIKNHPVISDEQEDNVHYVTFMMSDGDNIAYNMWSQKFLWDNPIRGQLNVGWGMMPSTQEQAPLLLRSYYTEATSKDHFFAMGGVSGTYPSIWPKDKLVKNVSVLNDYMKKSDLKVLSFLDLNSAWNTLSMWDKDGIWDIYSSQPNIDGIIFASYNGGEGGGEIKFMNGKPITMQREVLWKDICDEPKLINNINSYISDPYSKRGYSAVLVHVWTKDLQNIKTVIAGLDSRARIVSPEELMLRMKKNVFLKTYGSYITGGVSAPADIEAENFDKGGERIAYHKIKANRTYNEYRPTDSLEISKSGEDYWVNNFKKGEFLRYTVNSLVLKRYYVSVEIKSTLGAQLILEENGIQLPGNIINIPANTLNSTIVTFPELITMSNKREYLLRILNVSGSVDINKIMINSSKPSGLNLTINSSNVEVYPNPAKDILNIEIENIYQKSVDFQIFDLQGRLLENKVLQSEVNKFTMPISDLNSGIYLLAAKINNQYIRKRFVVTK